MPEIGVYSNLSISPYVATSQNNEVPQNKDGIEAGAALSGIVEVANDGVINDTPLQLDLFSTISDEGYKSTRESFAFEEDITAIITADGLFNEIAKKLNEQSEILELAKDENVFAKDSLEALFIENSNAINELKQTLEAQVSSTGIGPQAELPATATRTPERIDFSDNEAVINLSNEIGNAIDELKALKEDIAKAISAPTVEINSEDEESSQEITTVVEAKVIADAINQKLSETDNEGNTAQANLKEAMVFNKLT